MLINPNTSHHNGLEVVDHGFIVPQLSSDDRRDIAKYWRSKIFGDLDAIMGADEGTNERADVVFQTLDGADLNAMWTEFNEMLQMYSMQRERLVNFLTYSQESPIEQVRYPTQENFEIASEYGEPHGIRLSAPYNMGFDFQWYDLAIRYTWQFLIESTQAQIEALANQALEADNRLMFNMVMKCAFNPLDVLNSIRNIPVTVYKFWNGDGIAPPYYKNYTFDGSHSHYLTTGSSTLNSAGIQAIETTLYHHGYSLINGYKLVLLVNRQEGVLLRAARVVNGWEYDFIPGRNVGGGVFVAAGTYVGGPGGAIGSGAAGNGAWPADGYDDLPEQIGYYGPFAVVEEDYVPPGYVLALASGGSDQLTNPIGIREHENASARGLKLMSGDAEYPLKDSWYRHGFGTGIRHRGGGAVLQVTTSGTYTVPSAYA